MWSGEGRRETPRWPHKFDESPLDPGRLTPRADLRQRACSLSAKSLSLKLSGDQLTESCVCMPALRPFCTVHCANETLEQLRERPFLDRARAARKSSRDPIGRAKSSLARDLLQVFVNFIGQFKSHAHSLHHQHTYLIKYGANFRRGDAL